MPGLRKATVEEIVLDGLREGPLRPEAVAQFRKDYPRHLAELNRGASQRISRRAATVRSLEQKLQGFREAIGAGRTNPSIFEWLTETEEQLAALRAETKADESNVIQLPEDLAALYRAHVERITQTLSGEDVVGRASNELHRLIARITVSWKSRTQAIAERGYDAEQVDREIAAERKREAALGLDFRRPGSPAQAAGGVSEDQGGKTDPDKEDQRENDDGEHREPRPAEEG